MFFVVVYLFQTEFMEEKTGINADLMVVGQLLLCAFLAVVFFDFFLLFLPKKTLNAKRTVNKQMSLSDENPVLIDVIHEGTIPYYCEIIEEAPDQFQMRYFVVNVHLRPNEGHEINYNLRPVKRGEYHFGNIVIFLTTGLRMLSRKVTIEHEETVAVYPSVIQMKKYELKIVSRTATLQGIKKIRRLGMQNEFEQIKNYVVGDDYRSINWRATSRRNELMVNQYQDERSQQVFCIIDKSRSMRMPFNEMSLLDYAINSSLVMANTAMIKGDKTGLITFSDKLGSRLKAEASGAHLKRIIEILYKQKTDFLDANFQLLYTGIRRHVKGRSLLLMYTNFDSMYALHRVLPMLRRINQMHLLVVIFFENSELADAADMECKTVKDIYFKTMAEKFILEKQLIVRELAKYGIQSILSKPEDLSVDSINKYLELKSRGMI